MTPARRWDREPSAGVLSDAENKVATKCNVTQWAVGSELGHAFVLVEEVGEVSWLQERGAMENGGMMFVPPHEIVRRVGERL